MSKRIIKLTESDLENIVRKVLEEQSQQSSAYSSQSFKPKNYGSLFDLGKYQDESGKIRQAIEQDKEAVVNFINSQDFANFTAKIIAGESQVTNPANFKQKGSLALARAKTVYEILTDVYSELINEGQLKIVMPSIREVVIGKTPYKPGDQNDPAKLEQYKKEQYVSMNLQGSGKTLECNKPLPVKGRQAQAPNFEFIYGEELRLNRKIKGINYQALTIPDRPIVIFADGKRSTPPYFVREKVSSEEENELKYKCELALKNSIYSQSLAFKDIEVDNSAYKSIVTYVKGGIIGQQTIGGVLVTIFNGVAGNLTPELKKLNDELVKAKNTLTPQLFNANTTLIRDVFSKTPKIVTNSKGTPFNVNMQQTRSIKIGSYAPLDDTQFIITPYCQS